MRNYQIAVIPGDGIGQEVIPEGLKALKAVSQVQGDFMMHFETFPWGSEYYLQHGRMMPPDGLSVLEGFDAIYFGAVGWPSVPDAVSLRGLRLSISSAREPVARTSWMKVTGSSASILVSRFHWGLCFCGSSFPNTR